MSETDQSDFDPSRYGKRFEALRLGRTRKIFRWIGGESLDTAELRAIRNLLEDLTTGSGNRTFIQVFDWNPDLYYVDVIGGLSILFSLRKARLSRQWVATVQGIVRV